MLKILYSVVIMICVMHPLSFSKKIVDFNAPQVMEKNPLLESLIANVSTVLPSYKFSEKNQQYFYDNDALVEKIASVKQRWAAEFTGKHGEITAANRNEMLSIFMGELNAMTLTHDTHQTFEESVDIAIMDIFLHKNLVYQLGTFYVEHLDFNQALASRPDNSYLKALAQMHQPGGQLKHTLLNNLIRHDDDKFSAENVLGYLRLNRADIAIPLFAANKCNTSLNFKEEIIKNLDETNDAVKRHIENNNHHPEYWMKTNKPMDAVSVFEMFVDGIACGSRHQGHLSLKESNNRSKGAFNWGRLNNAQSAWGALDDREQVFEALVALMEQSEAIYGSDITVKHIMNIAQQAAKKEAVIFIRTVYRVSL